MCGCCSHKDTVVVAASEDMHKIKLPPASIVEGLRRSHTSDEKNYWLLMPAWEWRVIFLWEYGHKCAAHAPVDSHTPMNIQAAPNG